MTHDVAEADVVVQVPTGVEPVRAVNALEVYPVIGLPPSLAGDVHATVIDAALPAVGVAVTAVGAPGDCAGEVQG